MLHLIKHKKLTVQEQTDLKLLKQIYHAKNVWSNMRYKQTLLEEPDKITLLNTKLAKMKFNYLYHQARIRKINSKKLIKYLIKNKNDYI